MSPRANWKGFIKIDDLSCPVALYTATSASERIAFHTIDRATRNRVHRQFIDQITGRVVQPEDQVKGYEVGKGEYVVLEPEEIAAAFPESDKTLSVEGFIPSEDLDDLYFERPYYLAPRESVAQQSFALMREAMRKAKVVAFARAVLFRRMRNVVIRPYENGMIATLLNFDYEVRSATDVFDEIPPIKSNPEMLDLAKHIIRTKLGRFDPGALQDRYEAAIAELVKAKIEGKTVKTAKPAAAQARVVDLIDALRRSAAAGDARPQRKSQSRTRRTSGSRPSTRRAPDSRKAS